MSFKKVSPLTNVNDLLNALDECSGPEYAEIYHRLNFNSDSFIEFQNWSEDHYTRNCIVRTEDHELILLCWEEGQETSIHSHNDQECWVYNLQGTFTEEFYLLKGDSLEYTAEQTMQEGENSHISSPSTFHRLINSGKGRAMSLHLYVKPIDECLIYDECKEDLVMVELTYDSVEGKVLASD